MIDLTGRRALITGAASGIGAATAALFARLGACVAVADIDRQGAEEVAEAICAAGGTAVPISVDVAAEEQVAAMVTTAVENFGGLDVLHNNAAAVGQETLGRDRDIMEMTVELWDRTHAVALRGVMLGCKHALPHLLESPGACIVNTASTAGQAGDLVRSAYGAAKAGVESFTRYLATMYGHRGLRANAIAPGLVLSPIALQSLSAAQLERFRRGRLVERPGTPDDVAAMAAFLVSDHAGYITGQTFAVDGGLRAHFPTYADTLGLF